MMCFLNPGSLPQSHGLVEASRLATQHELILLEITGYQESLSASQHTSSISVFQAPGLRAGPLESSQLSRPLCEDDSCDHRAASFSPHPEEAQSF